MVVSAITNILFKNGSQLILSEINYLLGSKHYLTHSTETDLVSGMDLQ